MCRLCIRNDLHVLEVEDGLVQCECEVRVGARARSDGTHRSLSSLTRIECGCCERGVEWSTEQAVCEQMVVCERARATNGQWIPGSHREDCEQEHNQLRHVSARDRHLVVVHSYIHKAIHTAIQLIFVHVFCRLQITLVSINQLYHTPSLVISQCNPLLLKLIQF